jgi:hypothetical protein
VLKQKVYEWWIEKERKDVLGEWRYSSTHSLTSALDGGEWSASRPGRLTARETAPGTHLIGGWVGPRADLDMLKWKIPSPRRESNPDHPARSQSQYRLRYTKRKKSWSLLSNYPRICVNFKLLSQNLPRGGEATPPPGQVCEPRSETDIFRIWSDISFRTVHSSDTVWTTFQRMTGNKNMT